MRRRNRNKKQVKIVISTVICLLLIMTSGYAAFSTNLTLTAKGNIKDINAAWQLKKQVVANGEGLYSDSYKEGRYVYKGSNPDNYIIFNGEEWRIISVEKDNSLKLIRNKSIGAKTFDVLNHRSIENNTYCTLHNQYGCNAWGAVSGNYVNYANTGTVTQDSSLNIYLNGDYYNSLTEKDRNLIKNNNFKIGGIYFNTDFRGAIKVLEEEQSITWNGKLGLLGVDDYYKASNNLGCTADTNGYFTSDKGNDAKNYPCGIDNYLNHNIHNWLLNPCGYTSSNLTVVTAIGYLDTLHASENSHVYPVLYLKEEIILTGYGSRENPYVIS